MRALVFRSLFTFPCSVAWCDRTYNVAWQEAVEELNEQLLLEDPTLGEDPSSTAPPGEVCCSNFHCALSHVCYLETS